MHFQTFLLLGMCLEIHAFHCLARCLKNWLLKHSKSPQVTTQKCKRRGPLIFTSNMLWLRCITPSKLRLLKSNTKVAKLCAEAYQRYLKKKRETQKRERRGWNWPNKQQSIIVVQPSSDPSWFSRKIKILLRLPVLFHGNLRNLILFKTNIHSSSIAEGQFT